MPMTTAAANDWLLLLLNNTDWANIGDATGLRGSSTAGSLYVSLHTANPGLTGSQTTNEADYTSYDRVAVARSGAGWTVVDENGSNAAAITHPTATGGSNTITHVGLGTAASGAGNLLVSGALDASLAVSNGIGPEFAIGELDLDAA